MASAICPKYVLIRGGGRPWGNVSTRSNKSDGGAGELGRRSGVVEGRIR